MNSTHGGANITNELAATQRKVSTTCSHLLKLDNYDFYAINLYVLKKRIDTKFKKKNSYHQIEIRNRYVKKSE